MMKKIFFTVLIIVTIAAAAAGIFVATFDINSYKGLLESRLGAVAGGPVELGRLSLGWNGGLRVGLDGLKIYPSQNARSAAVFSVEKAEAGIDPAAMLARRLRISSVLLVRPEIRLVRSAEGRITLKGCDIKGPGGNARIAAAGASAFDISAIRIVDGTLRYAGVAGEGTPETVVSKIDADIRNVSVPGPVTFSLKAAAAGGRQDLEASGTAGGWTAGKPFLKDFRLKMDLASLARPGVPDAMPALRRAGIKEGIAGALAVDIRELSLEGGKISNLRADILLKDGRLEMERFKVPAESLNLDMSAEGTTVTVRSFSARMANGSLAASARIEDAFTSPRAALKLSVDVRGLESFLLAVASFNQNLDGDARITFEGSASGADWPQISRTLAGGGTFSLDRGVIIDTNVLDQTIGALTVFPNLIDSIQGTAPASDKKAISEKQTILKPLSQTYTIEKGYIILPDFSLQSDYADMQGDARMSLTGDLSGDGMIRFNRNVSGMMLTAVPQMRAITDPQGLFTFPIAFKAGSCSRFKVIPDMKYIGMKVAVQTAGDAVSTYLKKAMDSPAQPQDAVSGEAKKAPKIKDFLKALSQ